MTREEAKWVLELVRDRYSSIDIDRYSLTDAETDAINMAIKALKHLDNIEAYMHDFDVTEEEAIKALERKRGIWMPIERGDKGYSAGDFICSCCGKPNKCYSVTDYCCSCGAQMQRGEKHE